MLVVLWPWRDVFCLSFLAGFESILEGIYGPMLLRDLNLFDGGFFVSIEINVLWLSVIMCIATLRNIYILYLEWPKPVMLCPLALDFSNLFVALRTKTHLYLGYTFVGQTYLFYLSFVYPTTERNLYCYCWTPVWQDTSNKLPTQCIHFYRLFLCTVTQYLQT